MNIFILSDRAPVFVQVSYLSVTIKVFLKHLRLLSSSTSRKHHCPKSNLHRWEHVGEHLVPLSGQIYVHNHMMALFVHIYMNLHLR